MTDKNRLPAGRPVTSGLFLEEYAKGLNNPDAIYTIQREDRHGCTSLHKLYMDHCDDPTELSFVNAVFNGDVTRWEAIRKCRVMKPVYNKWLEEAYRKRLHNTVQHLIDLAADTSNPKNRLAAATKLLAFQRQYQKEQEVATAKLNKTKKPKAETSAEDKLGASILAALSGDDDEPRVN